MCYESYCELIDSLCRLVGVSDPSRHYDLMTLNVDDEDCSIAYGGQYNQDRVTVSCVFGKPPEQRADEVLQRLLEVNLSVMPPGGLRFGIEPVTGDVILSGCVAMAGMGAEGLLRLLSQLASEAVQWRRHFFLTGTAGSEVYEPASMTTLYRTRNMS